MSSTGAGRFAVGARFAWVEEFLKGTGSLSSQIAANTATKPYYTKNEIFTALNITQFPQKVWSMNQYNYQDNITDYAERTLIYNTMSFQIAEDAKFYVNPSNGSRYIDNFAVLPTTTVQENFDFNSIDGFTSIANIPLKTYLDPSGIGRTVNINFVGDTARTNHYDLQSLAVDKSKIASWSGLNPVTLAADGNQLLDQLFNDGITKFLTSDNKPILYGTVGADTIAASDIGSISHHISTYIKQTVLRCLVARATTRYLVVVLRIYCKAVLVMIRLMVARVMTLFMLGMRRTRLMVAVTWTYFRMNSLLLR